MSLANLLTVIAMSKVILAVASFAFLLAIVFWVVPVPVSAQGPLPYNSDFSLGLDGYDSVGSVTLLTSGCYLTNCVHFGSYGQIKTRNVYIPSNYLITLFAKGDSGGEELDLFFDQYDGGSAISYISRTLTSSWTGYYISASSALGRPVKLTVAGSYVSIGRLFWNGAVYAGFPLYGAMTPLPIDWSNFPTPVPYPTFPAFPTPDWSGFPTIQASNYTTNTTNNNNQTYNTTNNTTGGTTNNQFYISGTLQYTSTNQFPYGAGTPIPVSMNGGTPIPTMVSMASQNIPSAVSMSSASSLASTITDGFDFASIPGGGSPLVLGGGTNHSAPIVVNWAQNDLVFQPCGFGLVQKFYADLLSSANNVCLNYKFHVLYLDSFIFAGYDILPLFYSVAWAWYFVFLVSMLRRR